MDDLEKEISETREKLMTLQRKLYGGAPMSKDSPRIVVNISHEEFREIQGLARRSSTSVSALGQLAFRHLLIQSRAGALPMLSPSKVETAAYLTEPGKGLIPRVYD